MAVSNLGRVWQPLALVGAVVLVLALAVQNRSLRAEYAAYIERATSPHSGLYVPTVRLATLDGDTATIGSPEPGESQILFFLTTTCPYCRASLPAWKGIASEVSDLSRARVLGIALDSLHLTEEYVRTHGLDFPVITTLDRKLAALYRIRSVPTTLVVNSDGRVVYAKLGELSDAQTIDSVLTAAASAP